MENVEKKEKEYLEQLKQTLTSMLANPHLYEQKKEIVLFHMGIKFTKRECAGMELRFRRAFEAHGRVAGVKKQIEKDGKTISYKIWFCAFGFNVAIKTSDITTAKSLFVAETHRRNTYDI